MAYAHLIHHPLLTLMIEGFEVILFVFFPPSFVEAFLRLSPFVFFGFESSEDERNGNGGILLQAFDDVHGFVAVNPLNRLTVSDLRCTAYQ